MVILAAVLLGWGSISALFSGGKISEKTTREIAMSCTLDMYTNFHIHPRLSIRVNGVTEKLPTNIGITFSCMHPLHTHDETGEIHVESPEKRDFTLGDFFAVWGKMFDQSQILDYKSDAEHEIVMTVDGKPSTEFEELILIDKQQIVIEYKKLEVAE